MLWELRGDSPGFDWRWQLPSPHTQANITNPSPHIFLSQLQDPSQPQLQPTSTTPQELKREIKLICTDVLLNWLSVREKP